MQGAQEKIGTLDVALEHARRLLRTDASLAAEQCREILKSVPGHPAAILYLGAARRALGDTQGALELLEPLARSQPNSADTFLELGLSLARAGRGNDAIAALRRAVALKPDLEAAWLSLADHLFAVGDQAGADEAYARHIKAAARDPELLRAAVAMEENNIPVAEALLRERLKKSPTDVAAIRMLAEVAGRLGRNQDAEILLRRCVELAPTFQPARHNLALVLHRENKAAQALEQLEILLKSNGRNPGYLATKAAVLGRVAEFGQAIAIYEHLIAEYPGHTRMWLSYGHTLKTSGRQEDAIRAYRRCIELQPDFGEAYWSLADLKTFRFDANDVEAMRVQLARADLSDEDRRQFSFALGKALEDAGEYAESFQHYLTGNALRRKMVRYEPRDNSLRVRRSKEGFTREFFAARQGYGSPAVDPIFIVGLPRAGSTLLEQILSSHSMVEGTMELPDIISMARALRVSHKQDGSAALYQALVSLDADAARALGEEYLARTRIQRKTDRPFFIDKMPNNFAHIGLIHLILPNARIVDARRHPLACCLSGFKQNFARGQSFTFGLEEIGQYYRDYVELMAHFDDVLPGRIHRVIYEHMVEDTENEVRRLLAYCGLPFEEGCLRFYENRRAVRTASSEQVRRPIYREGVDQWRNFEPWLEPLKRALGPVLDAYPEVPVFGGT